jgi:hypothetical protein
MVRLEMGGVGGESGRSGKKRARGRGRDPDTRVVRWRAKGGRLTVTRAFHLLDACSPHEATYYNVLVYHSHPFATNLNLP